MLRLGSLLGLLLGIASAGKVTWPGCQWGKICDNDFEALGCFEQGPKTPWCHQVSLPQKTNYIEPKFYFHSPDGRVQNINWFALNLSVTALTNLDTSRELFFIIHGFGSGWPRDYVAPMAKALNGLGANVIAVRWDKGSADPDYFQATANTRIMGAVVAKVLERLSQLQGFSPANATLIGFSLGAHVAGFAGSRTPGLKRIIALDPAGPLYASEDPFYLGMTPETRLNKTDAQLVQCIHTDGLSLPNGGAGTIQQFGHIDFYPNGGQIQPGCGAPAPIAIKDLGKMNWTAAFDALLCPHERSDWLLTTAAINLVQNNGCAFQAFPCSSPAEWAAGACTVCPPNGCPIAGPATDLGTPHRGMFFFGTRATNASSPALFCGDQYHLLIEFDVLVRGSLTINITGNDLVAEPIHWTIQSALVGRSMVVTRFGAPISYLSVLYKRDKYWWGGGPMTFRAITVELQRLGSSDGGYRSYFVTQVTSGETKIIPLRKDS